MGSKKDFENLMDEIEKELPEIERKLGKVKGIEFSYRKKDLNSALKKLERKPDKYKKIEDLGDLIGFRIHINNPSILKQKEEEIRKIFKPLIRDINDYINYPRPDYKGVVQYNLHKNMEIQIRSILQTVVYEISHDYIYKPVSGIKIDKVQKERLQKDITNFSEFIAKGGNTKFRPESTNFEKIFIKELENILSNRKKHVQIDAIEFLWEKQYNLDMRKLKKSLRKLANSLDISLRENYQERLLILINKYK